MSEQSKEVTDAIFQQKVLDYIKRDEADKAEIKQDLKTVSQMSQKHVTEIAVIKTEAKSHARVSGAISGAVVGIVCAVIAGLVEWICGFFGHK
jgi:hypothetical protein